MKKTAKLFAQGFAMVLAALILASCCASQAPEETAPAMCPSYAAGYSAPQEPYDISSEEYGSFVESGFHSPEKDPLSTFSIDVDTASYSNIRRYLNDGALPPGDAVRVEECINYFTYDYENPSGSDPISASVTVSDCPWNEGRYLARIAL